MRGVVDSEGPMEVVPRAAMPECSLLGVKEAATELAPPLSVVAFSRVSLQEGGQESQVHVRTIFYNTKTNLPALPRRCAQYAGV